ncbi:GNAT family N-acetyltransferase [Marinobacter sp. F3R08]|uniref:GNAT family N-acetyltransferase n=1 Tax=Marinobacter sp. F3R08 TaxID=2841559 RepID=UPI001C081515|nr:GNAT family N-acetyltransferase [Marinobacter sp. F3R08]MBU2952745.1 GNAT family N-acetyltransferase [Marinobacter sp. F3R08]
MDIEYSKTLENISWSRVSQIFEQAGWGRRSPESLERAFAQSSFCRFAYVDGELVGFGRTVDDGEFYGWVVDLVVIPDYQGLGVGTRILKELEASLSSFITTMLVATEGNGGFYERQGWFKQRSAYIYPRSEKQIEIFGER